MRELVILSGKGGTGKTSLTAAFASLAQNNVICDADVDAADLHLLAQPEVKATTDFMGGGIAEIVTDSCIECGTCREVCRFDAIDESFTVNPISCEGCGVCVDMCPEGAINFPPQKCGEWFISDSRFGPMVHARLGIAEENSGKLVSLIRKEARELAEQKGHDLLITDGPPGIGCPVIASISGATALVIVVEPTVSGIHDMLRVAELAKHFQIPGMVLVNKFDLNQELTASIEQEAAKLNMKVLGRVPFDTIFVKSMVKGVNIFEYEEDSPTLQAVRGIWEKIVNAPVLNNMGVVDLKATIQ
ncbi:ATP-binding protein [Desulfogranum marinum]|uniref:ATP-binding protein n=1 Tax=Desulfogranum marinum TaxID=453220 RepID=UPI0019649647|nr:ATP-binding protein [Desulfogranum marinum]MBM9514308.1 4Fe-4S binding protein [Desulfogranum marinum]